MRRSRRSKRLTLRVTTGRGLIVTAPLRCPEAEIRGFVERQRPWIEQCVAELEARVPHAYRQWPPAQLELSMIGRSVNIEFASPGATDRARAAWSSPSCLSLRVDPADRGAVARLLAETLKREARRLLPPRLRQHAESHGLHYERLSIRGQRSVWGSYSSRGTLSLNYKLLFLPEVLVDYVMLHELAHSRYLNHSSDFWSLLESMVPGARHVDQTLSAAASHVPPWLELA